MFVRMGIILRIFEKKEVAILDNLFNLYDYP